MTALETLIATEGPEVWWKLYAEAGGVTPDSGSSGLPGTIFTYGGDPAPTFGHEGPECTDPASLSAKFLNTVRHFVHADPGQITGTGDFTMIIAFAADSLWPGDYVTLAQQRDWFQSGAGGVFDIEGLVRIAVDANKMYTPMSNGTGAPFFPEFSIPSVQKDCWHLGAVRRTSGLVEGWWDGAVVGSFANSHTLTVAQIDVGANGYDINRGAAQVHWTRVSGRLAHFQEYTHSVSNSILEDMYDLICKCQDEWLIGMIG